MTNTIKHHAAQSDSNMMVMARIVKNLTSIEFGFARTFVLKKLSIPSLYKHQSCVQLISAIDRLMSYLIR